MRNRQMADERAQLKLRTEGILPIWRRQLTARALYRHILRPQRMAIDLLQAERRLVKEVPHHLGVSHFAQ